MNVRQIQVRTLEHSLRTKLMTADDRLRDWALRGQCIKGVLLVSFARTGCLRAVNVAKREGREFTPIFWYYVDGGTPPVMTLWDVNDR